MFETLKSILKKGFKFLKVTKNAKELNIEDFIVLVLLSTSVENQCLPYAGFLVSGVKFVIGFDIDTWLAGENDLTWYLMLCL